MPWLLDTQGRNTRFAHSPASHRLFPDFPTIVFCLPQSGSTFLTCRRAGRCYCLCQLRASRRTSRRPQGSLASQSFHHVNIHCDLGATFQRIFHCIYHPSFNLAPTDYQLFLGFLPPSITCRCRRFLSPWCFFCIRPISTTQPPGNSCRLS